MIYALLLANFTLLLTYLIVRQLKSKNAISIFNVSTFYTLLMSFFLLDFYVFSQDKLIYLYEKVILVSSEDIEFSLFYLFLINIAFVIVSAFFEFSAKTNTVSEIQNIEIKIARLIFSVVLVLILFSLLKNITLIIGVFKGYYTRQVLLGDNKLLYILYSLLIPAYFIFSLYGGLSRRLDIITTLLVILVSFSSGSRGAIILILMFQAYKYAIEKNRIINIIQLIVVLPFLSYFLVYTRYIFREQWRFSSLSDFIDFHDGIMNIFFNTAEISLAEVLTTIVILKDNFTRYPFESFFGGLLFPVPRAIFPHKPEGASAEFTEMLSPLRWQNSKSEIVTTGFGDLIMQFGIFPSIVAFGGLIYIIFKIKSILDGLDYRLKIYVNVYLLWFLYVFIRADVYNLFSHLWSFTLILTTSLIFSKLYRVHFK